MCSAGFAPGLAFGDFAVDVATGLVEVALLGDAGDVEHAVDPSVATEVEAMFDGLAITFTGRQSDSAGAAPASELGLAPAACLLGRWYVGGGRTWMIGNPAERQPNGNLPVQIPSGAGCSCSCLAG